jgi:hypothetical protein
MNISARLATFAAIVFAALCFAVAITGFTSLGHIVDPVQAADAKGYAWFWTFLGSIAVVAGLLSWWIWRTPPRGEDA